MTSTRHASARLTALTLALALCSNVSLAAPAKTTVTLMTWEGVDTNKLIMQAMANFEKANPDIHVELIPTPNSGYDQKLQSMILAKRLPDLFWLGNDRVIDLGRQGALYDWSKKASTSTASFDLKKFAPASIENYRVDGKLYGLPSLMNTYGFFYNADLFKATGVPLPKSGWTYKDFFAAAKALTIKSGDQVTRYGVVNSMPSAQYGSGPHAIALYAVSAGGAPFQDRFYNPTKVTAGPEFVAGTKLFVDAIKNGYVSPPNYPLDNQLEAFAAGKLPMFGGGQWLAAGLIQQKPDINWGFAPIPVVNKRVQPYDAVGIASSANIKNPDAVWRVLTYLDTKAWETVLPASPVAPAAHLPSSAPYFTTLRGAGLSSLADAVQYELTSPTKLGIRFTSAWSGKANDVLTADWNNILLGKVDTEAGIKKMVDSLNTVIRQNP